MRHIRARHTIAVVRVGRVRQKKCKAVRGLKGERQRERKTKSAAGEDPLVGKGKTLGNVLKKVEMVFADCDSVMLSFAARLFWPCPYRSPSTTVL